MTEADPLTQRAGAELALATLAAAGDGEPVPAAAGRAARRIITNAVALAVGAAHHPAVERALAAVRELGGEPRAGLLGRPDRLPIPGAALVTGIAIHVEDYDDTHLETVLHPGAPVVAAALPTAEAVGATGAQLVDAVCRGAEVACRVGLALGREHFDRGWHVTGTVGHLGAAAAAGRLLALSPRQMNGALGLAATQAAGLQSALGTMTKSLHPGKAAADGIEAAMLARAGAAGPQAWLTGDGALEATMSDGGPPIPASADSLTSWEVERNAIKPYACGIVSHPVLDAARRLHARGVPAEAIVELEVTVNPVVLDVMGISDPSDGLESKFSVHHCAAIGLLDGAGGPPQFSSERARSPEVVSLRSLARIVCDPSIARDSALLQVRTAAGERYTEFVEHATASADNPMSDAELEHKARMLIDPVLGSRRAAALLARLAEPEAMASAGELVALACAPEGGER